MGHTAARGRRAQRRRARRLSSAVAAAALTACAAGCAYQYDDGLPPLGQRDAAASAAASAAANRPTAEAATTPLSQPLGGQALRAWARTMLPDDSGMSLATDASSVWPGRTARRMGADAEPGPATLHFACRGEGLAALHVTAGDAQLLDLSFACNRTWTRAIDVPAGHLDLQFSASGDEAANVAYRLTRP